MKMALRAIALAALGLPAVFASMGSPVSKVMELMSDMQAKITAEGKEAKQIFEEYQEWCEDQARKLAFDVKTERRELQQFKATIEDTKAMQATLTAKINKLAETISAAEAELKEATQVRKQEADDFAAESKELSEVISLLDKAMMIIKKEMSSTGASMVQLEGASTVAQALAALVQASMFSSTDANRITSFESMLQDAADDLGAPSGAAYESQSSGIIAALEGMLEKSRKQLAKTQGEESQALHNFEMLKQSLDDEIVVGENDMKKAKTALAANAEEQATAEGQVKETTKEIKADMKSREDLQAECMGKARDYEASSKSREDELKALTEAKKVIAESTGGAEKRTYGLTQTSLLQLDQRSRSPGRVRLTLAVAKRIREQGNQQHSAALTQLATRVATAISVSTMQGVDPFAKIRGMIQDLLTRLEKDALQDSNQNDYCNREMGETKKKKDDKDIEVEKLSTKIEQMSAKSSRLKEEVATLNNELADIAKSQQEMDALRKKERSTFVKSKAELEEGLEGVRMALKVLRDFYGKGDHAHDTSGSSSSVVAMVEVVESDFSKGLSEAVTAEEAAQTSYEEQSSDNKEDTVTKTEAVKFKTQAAADLDKLVSETGTDLSGVQEELDAVLEYLGKLKDQCIAKPDTYEEKKEQRDSEIASLKEALEILEGETALVQRGSRRWLRGSGQRLLAP